MKKIVFLLPMLFTMIALQAAVRLPSIIGSHMVLQQKSTVKLWGWSAPAENITIKVGWDTTTYKVAASRGARWVAEIKTPAAGGPYTITIKGSNEILLEDVLIGEVWVCGGQSNMEWSADQGLPQSKEESPNATNKQIRFFYVPNPLHQLHRMMLPPNGLFAVPKKCCILVPSVISLGSRSMRVPGHQWD